MPERFLLFLTAGCLGALLARLHIPIPFLLGGMLTAAVCKTLGAGRAVSWPKRWREYGLVVGGYGIGAHFDAAAWHNFLAQLAGVAESTAAVFAASILLGLLAARLTGADLPSCMLGMLPGGFTLSMLLAEEDRRLDPNIVMVMQVIRLLGVVVSVPFLVIYLLDAKVTAGILQETGAAVGVHWLVFVPLAVLGVFLGRRLHLPTPVLLGTILATAAFSVLAGGVQPVPGWLMAPAQVSIGLYMGMQLDAGRVAKAGKVVPCVILGTALMIAISIGMACILSARYGFSLVTAFLAMAPGGIAEMALTGMGMGEDVSIILTYQLVRVFAINFLAPPLLAGCLRRQA